MGVRFSTGEISSHFHRPGAHVFTYVMVSRGILSRCKAVGLWRSPVITVYGLCARM